MASRNEASSPANQGVVLTAPTIPGISEGGGGSSSTSQFQGIDNPEALSILMDYIRQTASGGTEEQRRQRAERQAEIQRTRALSGDYSRDAAFRDAADLMAQNLRQSLEANMPAISRSIQGAGTSASSMQGLLSQRLATESSQAASALGAEQARAYGNISANLQSVLEALTRIDPSIETNLLRALDLTRTSRQESRSVQQPTRSVTASGGGTYFQPIQSEPSRLSAEQSIEADYARQGSTRVSVPSQGYGFVQNNDLGSGTIFRNGGMQSFEYGVPNPENFMSELDRQYSEGWGYGD